MDKSNLQDIELSIFEKIKTKTDFPLWLKISSGLLVLLIIISLLSLLFLNTAPSDEIVKELTPTPSVIEEKKEVSGERKQWQTIKTQLESHDPLQKELLPPEIDLEVKFEQ